MKLTDDESELIEICRKATAKNNTDAIISIYATFGVILEKNGGLRSIPPLTRFTRGQYKRAIRSLRASQSNALRENQSELAADYDCSVRYIREHCLNRAKEAA